MGRKLGELQVSSHLAALIDDNFLRGLTRPGAQALNLKIRKQIDKRDGISQQRNFECCGSGRFIPDPHFLHPGSRIRIKEFKYFNPKKFFLSYRKYDPACSSRIRILIFYPSRITDPGVKKAPDPGSGSATAPTQKTSNIFLLLLIPYLFYHLHPLHDGAENNVLPVQPLRLSN